MSAKSSLASFCCLLTATLVVGACQRGPRIVPPASGPFIEAETALRSGDYARADVLYQQMISGQPVEREIGLARRALIHALPGTDFHDQAAAEAWLGQLRSEFPATMLGTEVEAVLDVLPGVESAQERLRMAVEEARRERELLGTFLAHASPLDPAFDPELARADYRDLLAAYPDSQSRTASERVLFLMSERERLLAVGAQLDEMQAMLAAEIEALREELERLKEIDLGRRLPN